MAIRTTDERRIRLLDKWLAIIAALQDEIVGVSAMLPVALQTSTTWELKAFEDALDAVICVWVRIGALEGRAIPYGDDNSVIWMPVAKTNVGYSSSQPHFTAQ